MSGKRPGRFGDAPAPTTGSPFGERRGAPLPLLTQPMVAVDRPDGERPAVDGPGASVSAAEWQRGSVERGDHPNVTELDPNQTAAGNAAQRQRGGLDGPLPTLKIDASAIAMGKPTVAFSAHSKPVEARTPGLAPPQIDLTQHHLPDGEPLDPRLSLALDPDSERAAAFRVLRHHLLELGRPQVVIVSSPIAGEGKTTTAVNLALALAECGRAKTLLVETHVRRPQLSQIFRFVPPWCFAEQLAAHRHQPGMPWSLIDIPQLWLHVAAINPRIAQTQLLDGPAFAIAMERLRLGGYDHIVVDAPPVLGSADVNLMADAGDSVVFALRARRSTTRDLRRAMEQLGGKRISGTVLLEDE